jgi:hypothetical protein
MTEVIDQKAPTPTAETTPHAAPSAEPATGTAPDLTSAVQHVLAASDEPLTVSKIRSRLPSALRTTDVKDLGDMLDRQVAANVLHKYPKYRSQQDRYWDRGMVAHITHLVRSALEAGPLAWSELRRKLPAYVQDKAQPVLDEQIGQGLLHRHPRAGGRGGDRFGVRPPDPRDYLRQELPDLFARLASLGFTRPQIRAAALELLHEEEWDVEPAPEPESSAEPSEEEGAAESPIPLPGPHTPAVAPTANHPDTTNARPIH